MMSSIIRTIVTAVVVSSAAFAQAGVGPSIAPYGAKVHFRQGQALHFRDFSLTFLGQRRKASPQYPRGFILYEFRVAGGQESRVVTWSSGTGEISPAPFRVSGQNFALELQFSDTLGKLQDDELVVTKALKTT